MPLGECGLHLLTVQALALPRGERCFGVERICWCTSVAQGTPNCQRRVNLLTEWAQVYVCLLPGWEQQ